jgi:hypothetical protein
MAMIGGVSRNSVSVPARIIGPTTDDASADPRDRAYFGTDASTRRTIEAGG